MKVRRPALRCLSPLPTTARRSPKKPASRYTRPRRTVEPRTTACRRSAPGSGALSLSSANALPGRRPLANERAPALFYDLGSREAPDRQDRSLLPLRLSHIRLHERFAGSPPATHIRSRPRVQAQRSSIYAACSYAALTLIPLEMTG